jgi:hypothetical protein
MVEGGVDRGREAIGTGWKRGRCADDKQSKGDPVGAASMRARTDRAMWGMLEAAQALMTEQYDVTFGVRPLDRMRSRMLNASVRAAAMEAQCSRAL